MIAAEILFYRFAVKKIAVESPVFGAKRQRCAQRQPGISFPNIT
jgi:hypothetical protein